MSTMARASTRARDLSVPSRTWGLAGAFMRAWAAVNTWRIRQAAIAHLRSLSDRELKDMGLSRSEIEAAVTGVIDLQRDRARIFTR